MNKEEVSNSFSREITDLGKELRNVIAENQTVKHKQRELKRAKINLERVKSSHN